MYSFAFLFAFALVSAAFVVDSFIITSDVNEAFTDIEYVVIGDSATWDGYTGCEATGLDWQPIEDVDVDGMTIGESRNVCIRFTNIAEVDIPFEVKSIILNDNATIKADCEIAFPVEIISGTAYDESTTYVGKVFTIATDAASVDDCQIEISVSRTSN